MADLTVAINSGGKSSRMGTDKSFVPLLGKPMIEHVLERVSELNQVETILVTNKPELYKYLKLPMFNDVFPEKGSLGGIYTAIYNSRSDFTLCVACDMPFLNPELLRYMISLVASDTDVIVPRVEGYPEGLHAIYSKGCLEPIRQKLETDKLKVIGFYDEVRVRYLDEAEYHPFDPKGLSFNNINTPDELQRAQHKAD
ncbi:MAG: molybdenum cofactor guanylyltransferase [Anaerolineae bacterium]|nr:molybdenum cofactor guanylyltransferase [Anaerolineae bacterium]